MSVWPFYDAETLARWEQSCRVRPPWYDILTGEQLERFVLELSAKLRMEPLTAELEAVALFADDMVRKKVPFDDWCIEWARPFRVAALPTDGVIVAFDRSTAVRICTADAIAHLPKAWRDVWVVDDGMQWMFTCAVEAMYAVIDLQGSPWVKVG